MLKKLVLAGAVSALLAGTAAAEYANPVTGDQVVPDAYLTRVKVGIKAPAMQSAQPLGVASSCYTMRLGINPGSGDLTDLKQGGERDPVPGVYAYSGACK